MMVWCRLLSDAAGAQRMLIMWQKQESKLFYPKALQQRHILIPVHLGATTDNLAGTHWGLVVFTHLQVRPIPCDVCCVSELMAI